MSAFACNFSDLSVELDEIIQDLTPVSCTEEIDIMICECAKDEVEKFNPSIQIIDSKRKKMFLDSLSEKINMGLLAITNDIVAISGPTNSIDAQKMGNLCSINKIKTITCSNNNRILSQEELQKYTSSLHNIFHTEINARYSNKDQTGGLVNRSKNQNRCGVEIPDSFTSQLKSVATTNMSLVLFQREDFKNIVLTSTSFKEALKEFQSNTNQQYANLIAELRSNPSFRQFYNNQEIFDTLKSNIYEPNLLDLAAAELTSSNVNIKIEKDITKRCENLLDEMENILCSSSDQLIPSDPDTLIEILSEAQSKNSVNDYLASSMILNKHCSDPDSSIDYDKHLSSLEEILPPQMRQQDSFKEVIRMDYSNSIVESENLVCGFFNNDKPLDVLKNIREECDNDELSKKCIYGEAAKALLQPQVNNLITNIEKEVIEELKESGVDESTPEYQEQFIAKVAAGKAAIKMEDIFDPYTKKPVLIQAFQGLELSDASAVSTNSELVSVSRPPLTGDSTEVVMSGDATSSGNISSYHNSNIDSADSSGQMSVRKSFNAQVQENTNNVFSEVARRITRAKSSQASSQFQENLSDVLRRPGPPKKHGFIARSPDAPTFNPQVDPFFDTPSTYVASNGVTSIETPTSNTASTDSEYSRSYEEALGTMAASEAVMARKNAEGANAFPKAGAAIAKIASSSGGGSPVASRSIAGGGGAKSGGALIRPGEVELSESEMTNGTIDLNPDNADKIKVFLESDNSKAINLFFSKGEEDQSQASPYQITILKRSDGSFKFRHTENELDARFMMFYKYVKDSFDGNNLQDLVRQLNEKTNGTLTTADKSSAPSYEALRDTF